MTSVPNALLLLAFPSGTEQLLSYTRESKVDRALQALADSILRSPNADSLHAAILTMRAEPLPMLAVVGNFDRAGYNRFLGLAGQLHFTLAHSRYIDWPGVERATILLAARLAERFAPEEIARFRFAGIPRGGTIVLGLLAYALHLSPAQLTDAGGDPDAPLVVVDDCSLTGLRFRRYLNECAAPRVVFCPMYAHPDLCMAIEAAEPRVVACIPAEHLRDHAREYYGERYEEWRWLWETADRNRSYWGGRPDHVAFPWSEPQTKVLHSETQVVEPGWEFLPASLCLKHRLAQRTPSAMPPQLLHPGPGPVRPADRVLWARVDDAYVVALMPAVSTGAVAAHQATDPVPMPTPEPTPCLRLEGTAADMWDALLECGTMEGATAKLADVYDVDPATLCEDLANFVTTLQNDGILTGA